MSGRRPDKENVALLLHGSKTNVPFCVAVSFWFFFFSAIATKEKEQEKDHRQLHGCNFISAECGVRCSSKPVGFELLRSFGSFSPVGEKQIFKLKNAPVE